MMQQEDTTDTGSIAQDDQVEGMMDADLTRHQDEAKVTETVKVSPEFAAFATEVLSDEPMKLNAPFEVRLNDVYDAAGRSVARCGYLHNTRASGPNTAEVVCAALNRYHGVR